MKSKISLYILVFLFCLIFLTGCTSKENISISEGLVKEGQELYQEKAYREAVDKFAEALEKYPSNFDAYVGLLQILLDKGFLDEASDLVQEASVRLNKSDFAKVASMVGDKYYEMGEYDSAKEMYKKGSNYDEGKIGLAKVYIQDGEISKAKKALKGDSENVEFLILSAYLTLDDWKEGSSTINEVSLNDIEDEKIKEQVSRLREIYTIDDEDALYKNTSLAGEYINADLAPLAIKLLNDQGDELEDYSDGQFFLGKAYLDSGDYDKAIDKLNNAILLDIDDAEVYVNLARAYLLKNDTEKALDSYKAAIATVKEENAELITQEYIDVLIENNMMNAAKSLLTDLIEENESFWMNIMLSSVYYKQKDLARMGEILNKLDEQANLTQSETRELTKQRLLYLMEDIKDVDEIEKLIERYSVFDRYNPEIPLFEGKLFKYQGENEKAKQALERAIDLDLQGEIADEATKLLATID